MHLTVQLVIGTNIPFLAVLIMFGDNFPLEPLYSQFGW